MSNSQQRLTEPIICTKHNQHYTNYCMICFEPLCPHDIQAHFYHHKETKQIKIETIKNTQKMCLVKINKIREFVDKENQKLDSQEIKTDIEKHINQIIKVKDSLINEIQKYTELKIKELVNFQKEGREIEIKKPIINATKSVKQYLQKLSPSHPQIIQTIKQVLELDDYQFLKTFFNQISLNLEKFKAAKVEIKFNQSQFKDCIKRCFSVNNPYVPGIETSKTLNLSNFSRSQTKININSSQSKILNPEPIEVKIPTQNPNQINLNTQNQLKINQTPINQNISQQNVSQIKSNQNQKLLNVSSNTFIDQTMLDRSTVSIKTQPLDSKFIHFFEPESTKLHLIRFPSFTEQVIDIKYVIPFYHKSVQLSNGGIILTGGTINQTKKNKNVYMYNPEKNTFLSICEVIPRSSHAICQHQGYIYIFGGIGQSNNIEKSVELLNLQTRKVEKKNNSKYGGLCLAISDGRVIFKLSQEGIQIYEPTLDIWKQIILNNYIFNFDCCCALMNKNEIMVFGGYDNQENGVKSNYSISLSTSINNFEDYNQKNIMITKINKFPLLTAEGFSDNASKIYNKKLYALQNIVDNTNEPREDIKDLICFDGKKWNTVEIN